MHYDIYSYYLVEFVYSKSTKKINCFEVYIAGNHAPEAQRYRSKDLNAELSKGVFWRSDDAILISKDADVEEAEKATNAMDLDCFNRVVNSVPFKDLGWGKIH